MPNLVLAQLSATMEEAAVERWLVPEGSNVSSGQPVVEITTDKVTMELESPAEGVIHIRAPGGTTVPVGTVLAEVIPPGR